MSDALKLAAMAEWLPAMARALGAEPPRRVPVWVVRLAVGAHAVPFGTTLRGNDNARFKRTFAGAGRTRNGGRRCLRR